LETTLEPEPIVKEKEEEFQKEETSSAGEVQLEIEEHSTPPLPVNIFSKLEISIS
jgi:hypothetical protein